MSTTESFRQLCAEHNLKPADVARILKRSTYTVRHWFSGKHYVIPENMLELLRLKLAAQQQQIESDDNHTN